MDIRLLITFQTIVNLGSFQNAAKELKYSQPTITTHIHKLEEQLGFKLFMRGKKLTLTEGGRFLLENIDGLLNEYNELKANIGDFINGDSGTIKIGVSEPITSKRFPQLMSQFIESKNEKVKFEVISGTTHILMESLIDLKIDLALCYLDYIDERFEFTSLYQEPMEILIYEGHPLEHKEVISLKDLYGENLFMTIGECPFKKWIDQKIKIAHLDKLYQNAVRVGGLPSIKYFVQEKLGIAILPKIELTPRLPGTIIKPLQTSNDGPIFGILTRKNDSTISSITKSFYQEAALYFQLD